MSLMKLKPCARCHQRLCYRAAICMQCATQDTGILPESLVSAVGHSPEPERVCVRNHRYTGDACPVCERIDLGFLMLAHDMLHVPEREPVPDVFYFDSVANWEV